jgi:hypothetical protein
LPGWSGEIGDTAVTQVLENSFTLGSPSIDILGPGWNQAPYIIDGSYSVLLQAGLSFGVTPATASLWQDGTIPANAESIEFKAWDTSDNGVTPPTVTFAGKTLSLFVLSSTTAPSGYAYDVYGANIAPYAGQTGQLEFTAPLYYSIELDDISFSPTSVIPEPSPVALAGIGGVLIAVYRRCVKRR